MYFKNKDWNKLKVKSWEKYTMETLIKVKLEWLYNIRIDNTAKNNTKDNRSDFTMINESSLQENIIILTSHIPNNRVSKYMKQKNWENYKK